MFWVWIPFEYTIFSKSDYTLSPLTLTWWDTQTTTRLDRKTVYQQHELRHMYNTQLCHMHVVPKQWCSAMLCFSVPNFYFPKNFSFISQSILIGCDRFLRIRPAASFVYSWGIKKVKINSHNFYKWMLIIICPNYIPYKCDRETTHTRHFLSE